MFGFAVVAAALTCALLIQFNVLDRPAALMAGVFVLAAILWITESVPAYTTSLIIIGLEVLLLVNPAGWPGLGLDGGQSLGTRDVLAAAADPVLVLFFGGLLLAEAAVKEGVDKAVMAQIIRHVGTRPPVVLLGLMAATAAFSMWTSNTATAAAMLALVGPLLAGLPPADRFRKAAVLGVAFAANIGGMATPIGTPPNALAIGYLRTAGHDIGFFEWMAVATPLMVGLLVITWLLLCLAFPTSTRRLHIDGAPPLTGRGWLVVAVFAVTAFLWLSEPWHGLSANVVALVPAVFLTATRMLDHHDLHRLDWSVLILIAGGVALGWGMHVTGLDAAMARPILAVAGDSTLTLLLAFSFTSLVVGTFMSNTAAANLMIPLALSVSATPAVAAKLSPHVLVMVVALMASVSMGLPISTPPNALAYSRGDLSAREMAGIGVGVGIIAAVAIGLLAKPVLAFWGVGS